MPGLFSLTTPETIGQHLQDLGIDDFTIAWTHVVHEIPAADVAGFPKFYSLVAGFWRWEVDAASAQRIEELMRREVEETAEAESYFRNTGNILLVEFRVPKHAHVQ